MMITIEYLQWSRKHLSRTDGDVLLLLSIYPEGLNLQEMRQLIGLKRSAQANTLSKLSALGCVQKLPKKRYVLCKPIEGMILD